MIQSMRGLRLGIALFALLVAASGCGVPSTAPPEGRKQITQTTVDGKHIGDPCRSTEGWQPRDGGVVQQLDPFQHAGDPIRHIPAPPDYSSAPVGIGYCAPATPMFPDGYWTSACKAASDCPPSATCVGSCVKSCTSDADCALPNAAGTPRCVDNPLGLPGKECSWPPPLSPSSASGQP